MKMNIIDWVVFALVIIGTINWGIIGIFEFDPIALIFGPMTVPSRIIYSLIGLSIIYTLIRALLVNSKVIKPKKK
jgi:hypothetical protein